MQHLVFVYGTLKRGFANHHYMRDAAFIGAARTRDAYPLVVGNRWFSPYLLPEPGAGSRVSGELWLVDDAMLTQLDRLESVHLPDGYRRAVIPVLPEPSDAPVDAFVYFRERRFIATIHTAPLDDYQDRRYVPSADRD